MAIVTSNGNFFTRFIQENGFEGGFFHNGKSLLRGCDPNEVSFIMSTWGKNAPEGGIDPVPSFEIYEDERYLIIPELGVDMGIGSADNELYGGWNLPYYTKTCWKKLWHSYHDSNDLGYFVTTTYTYFGAMIGEKLIIRRLTQKECANPKIDDRGIECTRVERNVIIIDNIIDDYYYLTFKHKDPQLFQDCFLEDYSETVSIKTAISDFGSFEGLEKIDGGKIISSRIKLLKKFKSENS